MTRVLVIGDSLAFHGPSQAELLTHPGLFPNVLGRPLDADLYSVLLPRADVVVLAVGGMALSSRAVPTTRRRHPREPA